MKTSNPKAKTARRFWSVLLSLVMALGMLPTAALAAEDDTEYDVVEGVQIAGPDAAVEIAGMSIGLPLKVTVQQGGAKAPPAETFEFELVDTESTPQAPSYYGISLLDDLKIETSGEGTFTRTVKFDVLLQNLAARHWRGITPAGSDQICWYAKTFLLNEKNTGTAGWDYSKTKYALTFWYDVGTQKLELEIHVPGNDVYFSEAAFTNTYTCNESYYEIPFTKTVTLGGSAAPGRETFELEIFDPGVSSLTDFDDLYTATVQTNGAGSYNGILTLSGPADRVEARTCEGFYVREKDTGVKNWTYSDAVWHVVPKWSLDDNDRQFATYPTSLERSPDGYEYYVDNRTPSDRMTFQNTYTYTPAVSRCEIPFTKIVTADGSADPGRQDFELEIFDPGVSSLTDFDDLYTAVVETDGAGSYNSTLTISGPEDQVEALTCEGFYVREKNTGAKNWIYSDAVWHIVPDYRTEDTRVLTIYPTVMERSENGYYYMDAETPASMTFKNTFVGSTYAITVKNSTYGDVTASHTSASKETTITLTAKPDQGYALDTITVLDSKNQAIQLTEKDGKFTFTMPADNVTVEASFKAQSTAGDHSFIDVPPGSWYEGAVVWAVNHDVTGGTGATTFSPDGVCTRAQAVTFLWRAAGSPAPKSSAMPLADVSAGSWYHDAVLWAVEQGITSGTSATTFGPNQQCTRAQIVTFLWRAAGSPAVSGSAAFSDVASGAYYAKAVKWAQANDVTSGVGGGRFGSNDNCTRAQIVTFIYRHMEK